MIRDADDGEAETVEAFCARLMIGGTVPAAVAATPTQSEE